MSLFCVLFAVRAPRAEASLGYEPDSTKPLIPLTGEGPNGIAIDQSNGRIYVAMVLGNRSRQEAGYVHQLESDGTPTANSPFTPGGAPIFAGVAVDPNTHGIYAADAIVETPLGTFGSSRIVPFSSSGVAGTPFATGNVPNAIPEIAVDSSGRIFYSSVASAAVKVYSSSGVVQETISCTTPDCPGGAFVEPTSVALDAADNLYVVDRHDGRVLEFTHPGGSYAYESEFQSGKHAVAVAVDGSNGSVLVGDYSGGNSYHVVAYEPSGTQFDDFGTGLFGESAVGVEAQIAIRASTHQVYVGEPGSNALRVFDLVTINPPTVTTEPATLVGQVEATLNSKVNANFHATSDCHFEYADDAFFQANGFTGSTQRACPSLPAGSQLRAESARITGLDPETTYHFRIVATNNAGSVNGTASEFTTLPEAAATAITEAATEVTASAARLKGTVNSHGGTASSCKIEYGATQSYGKSLNCPTPVGPTEADVAESAPIAGLSPSTTYHYRIAVTTNAGPVDGDDVEFTTVAPPPEEPNAEEPNGGSGSQLPPQWVSPSSPIDPKRRLTCRKGFRKRRVHGKLRCVKKHRRRHRRHRQRHPGSAH